MSGALAITRMNQHGEGVDADGRIVPFTLPGETVEAIAGEGARLTLDEVIAASPARVAPACPHFGTCGACSTQHWALDAARAWKRTRVEAALRKAGLDAPVAEVIDAHGDGRRRVSLHMRNGAAGYLAARTHQFTPVSVCPVLAPGLRKALGAAAAFSAATPDQNFSGLFTLTEGGITADLTALHAPPKLIAALANVARAQGLARVTLDGAPAALMRMPVVAMGPAAHVALPPGAFLQATVAGEAALARLAQAAAPRPKSVADLFCGLGPFTLRFAAMAPVFAADSDAESIAALRKAAAIPGFKKVTAERRDLFRRPLSARELEPFDTVIFDPPFAGAQAQASEIARCHAPTVIAISCNPVSFARDASLLTAGGYRIESVTPVDQFRWNAHIELLAVFRKGRT